jgi:hypothetical protein
MAQEPEVISSNEFFDTYVADIKPKLLNRTYIDYPYLIELRDEDFKTDSDTKINLNIKNIEKPYFVLFIDQTPESQRYLKMWLKMAEEIKNEYCILSFCNLTFEKKIDKNFKELSRISNIAHPFYWARYQRLPFALVYRDGWPVGFYNGGFDFQLIISFCITVVPDFTKEVEKFQKSKPGQISSLKKREMELLKVLEDERTFQDTIVNKKKLENLDTRTQVIAHAVGFDD